MSNDGFNRANLTGADFFTLVMERGTFVPAPPANVCRLVLRLDGSVSKAALEEEINSSGVGAWISSARWSRLFPIFKPEWKAGGGHFVVDEHYVSDKTDDPLPASLMGKKVSPYKPPAFALDLLHGSDGKTSIVLTWHHAMMDARGAEMLLLHLAGSDAVEKGRALFFFSSLSFKESFIAWLKLLPRCYVARKAIHTVARYCRAPIATVLRDNVEVGTKQEFKITRFDTEVTKRIDDARISSGAGFRSSIYYLAASIIAFHKMMVARGTVPAAYVVPVPQDTRKRGAMGPVFGNHFTIIFFRAEVDDVSSIQKLTKVLNEQMLDQMRSDTPKSFTITMELFRNLPVGIFAIQALTATKGQIASFFFSFPGDVLGGMADFHGVGVTDALHLPPANVSPGLSIIFSSYKGMLSSVISYAERCIDREEAEMLAHNINKALEGGS